MDGLIAEHISKTYVGAHGLSFAALRDVSIHLEPGSFTSLVGESGSGKSTLARLLVGLEPPDQGTISLDGEDTSGWSTEDWRKRRTKLQAVFQDASGTLNPMRSVRSNVEEAMVNLTSLSKRQRRERIGKLMELTHMEERLLEVPARQLSGGEQRRLSLVRAMSIRPKYLVLDEVLSGLDLISADAVMRVLEQYHREFDCAFLLITHDMDSAYRLSDTMEDVRSVVEENHMYIRIASSDFFAISQDVVSKMITGEYDAAQAYSAFNAGLLSEETPDTGDTVLSSENAYSNVFHESGGNASFSVMANTLRGLYGTDVLVAAASSFTGSVLQADYTQTTARAMIMPNGLLSYQRTMTGAELKNTLRAFVEGCEGGFTPFNRGSLPVVSGIAVQVKENGDSYKLTGVTRNGKPLQDDDSVTVTCLATEKQMTPLLQDEPHAFERGEDTVKNLWSKALSDGGVVLAAPESYITLE